MLFQIVLFGIFLSFYQMELFSAFLWLAESVVIFVSFLLIFYLNVYGSFNKINSKFYFYKYFGLFFFLALLNHFINFTTNFESLEIIYLDSSFLLDSWYDSLTNKILTDLFGLFISYYCINNLEFIIIVLFLLIGSLICVNINKLNRLNRTLNYNDLFLVFDFFKDFVKFIFMRKQNLVDQEIHPASTRVFKKKIN